MGWLKALERIAKYALAWSLRPAFWRPRRATLSTARLRSPQSVLLIRIDRRVGEALLMTPLMDALRRRMPDGRLAVLVHPRVAHLLEDHPSAFEVLTVEKKQYAWGLASRAIRALRRRRFDVVVNCGNWEAPSISSAIVARLVAPTATVVAPEVPPAGGLADVRVRPRDDTHSERLQRLHLLSPLGIQSSPALPSFRTPRPGPKVVPLLGSLSKAGPYAVVNPGGRLGWRRVPPMAFSAAARALVEAGMQVVVTWGPGEEPLARDVARLAPGAQLAPSTSLDDLASLLQSARLAVSNNTGPMHLAVAVNTPTLALFLKMPVDRWGYFEAPHQMLDVTPWAHSEAVLSERVGAAASAFAATAVRSTEATKSGTPSRTG